jgi:hypothetical protein
MKNSRKNRIAWFYFLFLTISLFTSFETYANHFRSKSLSKNEITKNYSFLKIEKQSRIFSRPVMLGYLPILHSNNNSYILIRKKKAKLLN